MSNKIDHVHIIYLNAKASVEDMRQFLEDFEDQLPEGHWVEEHLEKPVVEDGLVELTNLNWFGEGADDPEVFEASLELIHGRAEVMVIWESGELWGYRSYDGDVTRREVIVKLGQEVGA